MQVLKYLCRGFYMLAALLLLSCKEDVVELNEYEFVQPKHFPSPSYPLSENEISEAGFLLGRKLFYDPILSLDNSVSCNNCHQQATAFADGQQHPFSIGVDNEVGIRNSPALANLAFYPEFFWDGGVTHLDFVPINAIESDIEMKEQLANVVNKLNTKTEYKQMFKNAFNVDSVSAPFMLKALSQFMIRMVSANSRYDRWLDGRAGLNEKEFAGLSLFQKKCTSCHSGALFTDFSYHNTGLDSIYVDKGRATITEFSGDDGKFRVPSLRNVELTAPYMHNASFWTLKEVLDHYDNEVIDVINLSPLLKENETVGIALTEVEKENIIAFLKTLTDEEFIQNQLFVEYN